jgi:hypothetical protein
MESTIPMVLREKLKKLAKIARQTRGKVQDISHVAVRRVSEEHEVPEESILEELEKLIG